MGKIKREEIREPTVAGSFYPSNPQVLSREIRDFLDKASKEEIKGEIMALISPHAGYMYSGGVAAYGYKLIEGMEWERVIVIAPSHRSYFSGASIYPRGGYGTPLGVVPIEQELAQDIISKDNMFSFLPQAHSQEHSLEVQLPFLQVVLKEFKLVPIVMGSQDLNTSRNLSRAIKEALGQKKALIVASSDLSHYYPYGKAVELDKVVLEHINNFDPEGLAQNLAKGRTEACGGGAIVTALLTAQLMGADKAKVIKYANSGDITGDRSGVVGYAAAVVYKGQGQ